MVKFLICVYMLFSFSTGAIATDLEVSINHVAYGDKLYLNGTSNFPSGTKIGVELIGESSKYKAQDFNIIIDSDGKFISAGFSSKGRKLSGNYTAEIISYANGIWQNKSVLSRLKDYEGYGIENGKMLIRYSFSTGSSTQSSDQSLKQALPEKEEKLVNNFCYALQAFVECDDLNMRADTERKIEAQVGAKLRGPESIYNNACLDGLDLAFKHGKSKICSNAWEKYGCYGTDIPRLLQQNPFRYKNGVFCEY